MEPVDLGHCPSARYDDPYTREKVVFGIVGGIAEKPAIQYLDTLVPISEEMTEQWSQSPIEPGEVLRISGKCKGALCGHWLSAKRRCSLIDRWLVALEPADEVPACKVRPECRGWLQHGSDACRRCSRFASQTISGRQDPLAPAKLSRLYL